MRMVIWYQLAAAQEDATGQYNLGVMYENSLGVVQDYLTVMRKH
jgi:TPR repeat protein